jgi:hypothetical protein
VKASIWSFHFLLEPVMHRCIGRDFLIVEAI